MQNITTELPIGFSIFCLLMGATYAYFLYNKDIFEGKRWLTKVLAFLRFIVVSIIAFFLLEPYSIHCLPKIEIILKDRLYSYKFHLILQLTLIF